MPTLPTTFLSQTLAEFPQPLQILTMASNTTLRAAIETLLSKGVSSCPVLKEGVASDSLHRDSFLGMVDVIDIIAFYLEVNKSTSSWGQGFEQVLETVVQFADHTVGQLLVGSKGTLRHATVPTTTTMKDALELLGPKRTHRLLVIDNESNLVNIVTQSHMLSYVFEQNASNPQAQQLFDLQLSSILLQYVDQQGNNVSEPLVNSGSPIWSLKSSSKAVDAFKIIHSKRVTGVAVVDDQSGNLIGNISARDIRSLVGKSENFENLYCTAKEYLHLIKQERQEVAKATETEMCSRTSSTTECDLINHTYQMVNTQSKLPAILTVSTDDTVGYVVYCLKANYIRRVYLTSGKVYNGKIVHVPTSIVTISDLMKIFAGCAASRFGGSQ